MFIVLHKPTGKYFKKKNWRKPSEPIVAEKDKARVYRSRGAALVSVGKWTHTPREERTSRNFGSYSLDESIWEIMPVSLEPATIKFGCDPDEDSESSGHLDIPMCFLNTENGDLFIIWWQRNTPIGKEWVEISLKAWSVLTGSKLYDKLHEKGEI
jgi:hypothetical protein